MPEETPIEETTPKPKKKRNERTEAKFLEDVNRFIAETERLGAEYTPPSAFAATVPLTAKRDAVWVQRTVQQDKRADVGVLSNAREVLFAPLNTRVSGLIEYAKAAGKSPEDIALLKSTARLIRGGRAVAVGEGGNRNSVSHLSYATRTDNFALIIEQYDALDLKSGEDMFKTSTLRDELAALRQATTDLINAEAAADTADEMFDRLAYTDADSLLKGCVAGKAYIKSKYKTTGEPYKNIAKTRFNMPSRLR